MSITVREVSGIWRPPALMEPMQDCRFEGSPMSDPGLHAEFPGPPNRRRVGTESGSALPGTEVFSADTHISVTEDIWYQRFPASMKDRAPRIWCVNGLPTIGIGGQSFLP